MTEDRRRRTEDRGQMTEDSPQRHRGHGEKTKKLCDLCVSVVNNWGWGEDSAGGRGRITEGG